jgi:hypothetical protein
MGNFYSKISKYLERAKKEKEFWGRVSNFSDELVDFLEERSKFGLSSPSFVRKFIKYGGDSFDGSFIISENTIVEIGTIVFPRARQNDFSVFIDSIDFSEDEQVKEKALNDLYRILRNERYTFEADVEKEKQRENLKRAFLEEKK